MALNIKWLQIMAIVIVLLLVILIFIISNISSMKFIKKQHNFPGTQQEIIKHNCDTETIYSVNNEQCNAVCREPGVFVSRNGACVNILSFNQTVGENECDPKKGVVAYLIGDTQLGNTKLLCLSIDPGVQPDDTTKPNTMCQNGNIDIDYIEAFPTISHCTCTNPDDILVTILDTSAIRTRAACVKKENRPMFELNRLVYS